MKKKMIFFFSVKIFNGLTLVFKPFFLAFFFFSPQLGVWRIITVVQYAPKAKL